MSDNKPISLDSFREKKKLESKQKETRGTLVWLKCPACKTIEYTEIVAPNGRTHSCGTQVQEFEVKLDFKAELTITHQNLKIIDELMNENKSSPLKKILARSMSKLLKSVKAAEEEYLRRINIASNYQAVPYEGEFKRLESSLPIKKRNELGLYLSEFRFAPEKRFHQVSH